MIEIRRANARYKMEFGRSGATMSFSPELGPSEVQFGPLVIFNDDVLAAQDGIGMHPHRDFEIVTFMIRGQNYHKDSTGRESLLVPGMVQVLTAGTGIWHEGMNPSATEDENHLQIWFKPDQLGLRPAHHEFAYKEENMNNRLLPIVSNRDWAEAPVLPIHQDVTIFISRLEQGQTLTFDQPEGRRMFLFPIEGELDLNQEARLGARDAAKISALPHLVITALQNAYFMLIDLPPGFHY